MDSTLKDTLTANLKAAKSPEERDNALTLAMIAMIDCQYKTAQRVKALTWKVIAISLSAGGGIGAIATQLDWLKRFFANSPHPHLCPSEFCNQKRKAKTHDELARQMGRQEIRPRHRQYDARHVLGGDRAPPRNRRGLHPQSAGPARLPEIARPRRTPKSPSPPDTGANRKPKCAA